MLRTALGFAVSLGLLVVACSSSDSTPANSSSTSSGAAGTSGTGGSTCTCTGSVNGQSFALTCGTSQCVAGSTFSCGAGASLTQGEPCTSTTADAGTDNSNGCGLFTCKTTSDCGGIAPCFTTATAGASYCFEQEGSPDECTKGTTATTKTTSNGPTTICVPAGCPAPDTFVQ